MRRRRLIGLLAGTAAAWPLSTLAQRPRAYRVGWIAGTANMAKRLKQRLGELGYVEGGNLVLLARFHQGHLDRLPEIAAELVGIQCDVILATGPEAALKAVSAATRSIPIVMGAFDYDPVALGYVAGLPRPGGNVTGVFLRQVELTAKRVELLKETIPSLSGVAVLVDAFTTETSDQMRAAEAAAGRLHLRIAPVTVTGAPPYDYAAALGAAGQVGAGAVLVLMSPAFFQDRARLLEEISLRHMAASFGLREFADLGGLMSYGANLDQTFTLLADYVAKILNGAKPDDLPVQQPTKFELVINLQTAKTLGLTVPQSMLARADEVIE